MAYITINKSHFEHNLNLLAKKAGGIEKLMVVLKDNAYGHGLEIMANLASNLGVKKAAVKNFEEASKIANLFDEVLVLVDRVSNQKYPQNISLAINTTEALKQLNDSSFIHLNIDTGMHRNGIDEEDYEEALEIIKRKSLHLRGVFTHYRSADEISSEYFWQEQQYKRLKKKLQELIHKYSLTMPDFHSCNSAALLRKQKDFSDDYARCGIALYGYTDLPKEYEEFDLKPVMSLWAQKMSTRILKKGQKIGYAGAYEAKEDEKISTYDVGYGDGFFRFNTSTPITLTSKAVLVGKVSMDSLFLKEDEEEVALFEDVSFLANYFKTISYDILVKLSPTLKRKIIT